MINNAIQFLREVRIESQKVTWPQKKEVMTTTVVVLVMIGIMAVILLGVDFVISHTIQGILDLGK